MLATINQWHKTRSGLAVFALFELAITYGFVSLSIDRGNLWWYILALVFLIGTLQNFFRLIGAVIHGKHKASKA